MEKFVICNLGDSKAGFLRLSLPTGSKNMRLARLIM